MAEGQLIDKELEESRKKIESLEREKSELAEKSKGLADIIEQLSGEQKVDTFALEGAIGNRLKDVGEKFDLKIRKLEEGLSAAGKDREEAKKQIAALMKEKVDPKLTEISDKLKELDKIKDLGDRVAQLNERLSSPLYQPKQPGTVSQGLASFGEQVDFESELTEVKKTIDTINFSLANMSKKVEYRLSSAEDKLKELEKLKALDVQYREISDKIGAENLQKLKKIVFSADELMEEVIPEAVNRRIRKRVEPIVNSLKANRDFANELEKKVSDLDGEVRELRKFRDTINELRLEKDKLYKKFAEEEARFLQGLEMLKANMRKRMESMMEKYHSQLEKMREFTSPKVLEASIKDIFVELFQQRMQELEKHLMILDEKAKALVEKDRELAQTIEETEAPENLRKWISDQTKDIERKIYYDLQGLKKEASKNSELLSSLRERQKNFDASMNDFSRKMSDQASTLNKVIDLRDVFTKRAESLAVGIKSVEGKLSAEREKSIVLEQGMKGLDSKIGKISDSVSTLQKFVSEVRPLKERLSQADTSLKGLSKGMADKDALAGQVKRMEAEIASLKERHSRLEMQNASDMARFEAAIKQMIFERKGGEERVKKERVKVGELLRELKE